MALMLVACTSGQPDMPRATAGSMPSEGESGAVSDVIFVVPPEGAPLQTGLVLADAIAAEIRDSNHPAILAYHTNQAGASVVGKILSAVPRGNVTWLTMDWAIRAPYGTLVDTYRQRVVIDKAMWDRAAPEAINHVIADAAPKIVKMVSSQIGPPVMATMTHRNWRDQSNEDQFKDKKMIEQEVVSAAKKTNSTTMGARMAEHQTNRSATEIGGPQVASAAPTVQPLARIADSTNGQVVRAEGVSDLLQNDRETSASMARSESPRPPLPSLLTLPPIEEPETSPARVQGTQQAATLPTLRPTPAPSGPPTALTPVAPRSVSPPPGGVTSEPEESFLEKLKPNLGATERRVGDARPPQESEARFAELRWGQPAFLIRPVVGAPGNGNESLTAALKTALRDRDLTISEDPRQAGFIIDGQVDLGEPVNGRQYVKISWAVNTVTGEEVGRAIQENTVVAGSLDGEWGQVAEVVSQAAVRGIQDLFGDAAEETGTSVPLPDFPDVDLPAIPRRAPPPPSTY
jgi:hypothetical protein